MLTKSIAIMIIAAWMLGGIPCAAATLPTSDSRDTLFTQGSLENLSVGAVFEFIKRDMQYDSGGEARLEANTYCGYVGYDILQWLTLYGTLGGCETKSGEFDTNGGAKFKWSAGVNLKIWRYDLYDPAWLAGRCSIRAVAEYSQYQSGNSGANSVEWDDWFAAMTLNYEIFVARPDTIESYPYSLLVYAGPAFSKVDGKRETGMPTADFSEQHNAGIAAGADLFASHNLSVGVQVQYYFDQPTLSASVIYNF